MKWSGRQDLNLHPIVRLSLADVTNTGAVSTQAIWTPLSPALPLIYPAAPTTITPKAKAMRAMAPRGTIGQ